jgi:predicted flap endonuclease-1-like 5' DNA nuclease
VYSNAVDAFEVVLAEKPAILGVGEAHPLRGTEGVEPSVRRFTRDFLPLLRGVASDLVVELLLPNAACETAAKEARKEQRVVTEHQAATDQNDFVALGAAARALGIRAHALEPTCDDLKRISGAGQDAIAVSLDVVTRLSAEGLARYFDANVRAKDPRIVVGYGGVMHNDVVPRPGREAWSFGPAMSKLTAGRYVEVDLIVPEFIEDTAAWRSLTWFAAFDPTAHPTETTLLAPSPNAFVLIFPRGVKTELPPPSSAFSSGTP